MTILSTGLKSLKGWGYNGSHPATFISLRLLTFLSVIHLLNQLTEFYHDSKLGAKWSRKLSVRRHRRPHAKRLRRWVHHLSRTCRK